MSIQNMIKPNAPMANTDAKAKADEAMSNALTMSTTK